MNIPRFEILTTDMGGWVRVHLGRGEPTGEAALFLSRTLAGWMRKHPHLRLRFVVPISSSGDTSELHAWYEQTLFDDTSQIAVPDDGASL